MSQTEYYREQAAAALTLAQSAALPNVRTRYLTSSAVWAQLAERAQRLEQAQGEPRDADW